MSLVSRSRHVYFVGIGGIGMSGLAELLLAMGQQVSGSDQSPGESVSRLRELGAQIHIGHSRSTIEQLHPDVVVYSSAVSKDNPELLCARELGIPIIRRAEMLGELMRLKRGLAVAGSHGKTTTTAMLALILKNSGIDPTVVIGGRFDAIGSNVALGKGDWLIAESDESDGSFLRLSPEMAVVTNVDREHIDFYSNFESVLKAFSDFIDRIPFYGKAILCSDCPNLRHMSTEINKPVVWYGMDRDMHPDYYLQVKKGSHEQELTLFHRKDSYEKAIFEYVLKVPGSHNALNAVAATLMARELEVPWSVIAESLGQFRGVERRFEFKGEYKTRYCQHPVVEDYAHHPTEILATVKAAIEAYNKAPVVLFQPHRFSRTRDQWDSFKNCFIGARQVLTLPVYPASELREDWTRAFDKEFFAQNIQGVQSHYVPSVELMVQELKRILQDEKSDTPILVLGAGNIASRTIPLLVKSNE